MQGTEFGFNTMLLHGINASYPHGVTHVPIFQSSAFRHESAEELENIFTNRSKDLPVDGNRLEGKDCSFGMC